MLYVSEHLHIYTYTSNISLYSTSWQRQGVFPDMLYVSEPVPEHCLQVPGAALTLRPLPVIVE